MEKQQNGSDSVGVIKHGVIRHAWTITTVCEECDKPSHVAYDFINREINILLRHKYSLSTK